MLTDKMGGISTVLGDKVTTKGDREGKSDLLGDGVASENQRVIVSVERIQEVQSGIVTLEGRVAGDEG